MFRSDIKLLNNCCTLSTLYSLFRNSHKACSSMTDDLKKKVLLFVHKIIIDRYMPTYVFAREGNQW